MKWGEMGSPWLEGKIPVVSPLAGGTLLPPPPSPHPQSQISEGWGALGLEKDPGPDPAAWGVDCGHPEFTYTGSGSRPEMKRYTNKGCYSKTSHRGRKKMNTFQ